MNAPVAQGASAREWIDVSVLVRDGMPHWPGDPPVAIERKLDIGRGDQANVSHLSMGAHSGTHVDAPVHFIGTAAGLHQMPLAATVGEARVIQIDDPVQITKDELAAHSPRPGERLLFRTANSPRCWQADQFVEDFVYVSEPAAGLLAESGVRTIGVDYLSVGGFRADGAAIHRILLSAGIWIIEGLDLTDAPAGRYELICLPVRLHGADGSPARAIVRPLR